MKVVVVGGGWAGCGAALAAVKQGAEVVLFVRTDMLLGTGLVGGIMRNNGRFTAAEELIALGGGELFELTDQNALHRGIEFPGLRHASLYHVAQMEPSVRKLIQSKGIKILTRTRITDVEMGDGRITSITGKRDEESVQVSGDAFVDATGTAGPPPNCNKYGNGCVMCILRCHSFGGRVSLTAKAGVKEMIGHQRPRSRCALARACNQWATVPVAPSRCRCAGRGGVLEREATDGRDPRVHGAARVEGDAHASRDELWWAHPHAVSGNTGEGMA